MGDLIPFPIRGSDLTKEELLELYQLKQHIAQAQTFREVRVCKKMLEEWKTKILARRQQE
ncbi:hypothetical protein M3936_22760 [Sutcliffiella horikoshii]|uniref:hypothetical protein n=1 Tax=Sutcliffiella horikoshii TaxID=79883 RepID=UPI0007D051E5|nr:hypothetical protein [Sutcliffiella horikoshii]MCM3620382.1 hypothetical protein [Sutcliffiella horikoshii]